MTVIVTEEVVQKIIVKTGPVGPSGGGGGGLVTSVQGEIGDVTLTPAEIGAQPVDSDLTAISGLNTVAYGRSLLTLGDAAALLASAGAAAAVHTHAQADVTGLVAALAALTAEDAALDAAKQDVSEKGVAGGYASLDGGGKVPVSQLPASLMSYEGVWNASTNSPALADGSGSAGDVYRVGTAGSQNLGSGSIDFAVGDYVIYNGATWEKSDTTDSVASVAGKTGVVTLDQADISGLVAALAAKQDAATAATDSELTAGLATKAASSHTHPQSEITNLITDLAAKQDAATAATDADLLSGLATLAAAGAYINVHGSVAGTARVSGYAINLWIGSVEPTNAANGDLWVNTA